MAEFLIKAEDSQVPDGPGKWYAARIITVQEDGHEWGAKEGPPKFGLIKVPGIAKADAEQYLEEWRHNTTISIIGTDQSSDSYRLRLSSDRVSLSGKNAFNQTQIENFFTDWNANVVNLQNDRVTFDISVYGAITSPRFWGADVTGVVFVETEYNESTGDHLIQIQDSPFSNEQMRAAIESNDGTVIQPDSFIMNRSVARQKLSDDIEDRIRQITYDRRRWYITAAGMSALQAAGGILTVTPAQFVNNIADGLDD